MLGFFAKLSTSIQSLIKEQAPEIQLKLFKEQAMDGAVCDERHHQVVFEDETLRVIDVIVAPHEVETFHTHERCAVMYVDIPANIILDIKDEASITINNPEQRFAVIPEEGLHRVTNTDDKQFRAFRFEIKSDICAHSQFEALSGKICDLIKEKKVQLDELREKMLKEEQARAILVTPKTLTLQYADTLSANKVSAIPLLLTAQPKQSLKY